MGQLSEAIPAFIEFERFVRGVCLNSGQLYSRHLKRFEAFAGRGLTVEDAAPRVEPYLIAMGRAELAEATRAKAFMVLRMFYRWAIERGHSAAAPLRFTKMPRVHRSPQVWLTRDELRLFLLTAARRGGMHGERDTVFLATIYYCGLRVTEARQLGVDDFDAPGEMLKILGKGGVPAWVPVPPRLAQMLTAYLHARAVDSPWLFPSRARHGTRSGQLDSARAAKIVREITAEAGLSKRVTPHTLRRSAAEHLRRGERAPLEDVQAFLRHRHIGTTMIYLQETRVEAVKRWARRL